MSKFIDYAERLLIIVLAATFLRALFSNFHAHPYVILIAISECLPVALIMIRRPGEVPTRPYPLVLAVAGTAGPLLVRPAAGGAQIVPLAFAMTLMLMGLAVNIAAKLALWRSFGVVPANRGIRGGGPYRYVRHPMYLGYFLTQLGFLAANLSIGNAVKYLVTWTVQLLRIREEEKVLMKDGAYRSLAERVRFRLVPGLF